MFSVNNFYDYLRHMYAWPIKNNFVYKFLDNGARDLHLLKPLADFDIFTYNDAENFKSSFFGRYYMFDQEPFNFNFYGFDKNSRCSVNGQVSFADYQYNRDFNDVYNNPVHARKILDFLSTVRTPIICHSEKSSLDIKYAKNQGFLDVYYWYHALIARDWFRHWKHYNVPQTNDTCKKFGLYARNCTGSRKYRASLIEKLVPLRKNIHFQPQVELKSQLAESVYSKWVKSTDYVTSESSASINWNDCLKFSIQIVAETVFDSKKIHLTEKIFKPIVMQQPFILLAPSGSLEYIRSYGFQTFHTLWDESYDNITNSSDRMNQIINLIANLESMTLKEFNRLLQEANNIADHNRKWFYSQQFEDKLLTELNNNFLSAIDQQEENFLTDPGGTWFKFVDSYYRLNQGIKSPAMQHQINRVITQIQEYDSFSAKKIIKKYNHLF